ncbi:hypothetical protein D3C83_209550 [compost metagenome]
MAGADGVDRAHQRIDCEPFEHHATHPDPKRAERLFPLLTRHDEDDLRVARRGRDLVDLATVQAVE